MVGFKRWVRDFFGFSRGETNGFIILLPLLALIIFSEPVYRWWLSSRADDFANEKAKLDSLTTVWELQKNKPEPNQESTIPLQLFAFNPNEATDEELNSLGFPGNLAAKIIHYRAKGGKFRIKSDLLKIYGMDSTLYQQLYSYIELPVGIEKEKFPETKNDVKSTKESISKFDLNQADTARLKKIYGIGPVLAARIVKYRENLGGFVKSSQLNEVYGLDSAVVKRLMLQSFLAEGFSPKRININSATEMELNVHPYITKNMAKAIVTYRFQHGNFKEVAEIRNLQLVKNDIAEKIIPYLKVED